MQDDLHVLYMYSNLGEKLINIDCQCGYAYSYLHVNENMWLFILQLDAYWTYELCHGRHIKQFHELKAGVPVCILEMFTSLSISDCNDSIQILYSHVVFTRVSKEVHSHLLWVYIITLNIWLKYKLN